MTSEKIINDRGISGVHFQASGLSGDVGAARRGGVETAAAAAAAVVVVVDVVKRPEGSFLLGKPLFPKRSKYKRSRSKR